jgi:hypothetical protein
VATSLVDSPPDAPVNGQAPPNGSAGTAPGPAPASRPPGNRRRTCAKCDAALAPDQDWCLHCGAGAPGSLGAPGWRAPAAILTGAAILALGAAAVGYAALNKGTAKPRVVTTTVAQASTPAVTTPTTPATGATSGAATATPKTKSALPAVPVKPPKIPLTAITPKASGTTKTTPASPKPKASKPTSTAPASPTTGDSGANGEEAESKPSSILLDTDAAETYNPYELPASDFGDPSLAIDGDPSTAWTAQINPATAPSMAEGLLIDLKAKQKLSALELITSTPGMTVQVYGTTGHTAPTSITDPAWLPLSYSELTKKKHTHIKLRDSKKAFTFVTLWISKAPNSAIGTAEAPGHVDVNEVELFPAS